MAELANYNSGKWNEIVGDRSFSDVALGTPGAPDEECEPAAIAGPADEPLPVDLINAGLPDAAVPLSAALPSVAVPAGEAADASADLSLNDEQMELALELLKGFVVPPSFMSEFDLSINPSDEAIEAGRAVDLALDQLAAVEPPSCQLASAQAEPSPAEQASDPPAPAPAPASDPPAPAPAPDQPLIAPPAAEQLPAAVAAAPEPVPAAQPRPVPANHWRPWEAADQPSAHEPMAVDNQPVAGPEPEEMDADDDIVVLEHRQDVSREPLANGRRARLPKSPVLVAPPLTGIPLLPAPLPPTLPVPRMMQAPPRVARRGQRSAVLPPPPPYVPRAAHASALAPPPTSLVSALVPPPAHASAAATPQMAAARAPVLANMSTQTTHDDDGSVSAPPAPSHAPLAAPASAQVHQPAPPSSPAPGPSRVRLNNKRPARGFGQRMHKRGRSQNVRDLAFSGGAVELTEEERLHFVIHAIREFNARTAFSSGRSCQVKESVREYSVAHNLPQLISKPEALAANSDVMCEFLQKLIAPELTHAQDGDKIGIEISHPDLNESLFVYEKKENYEGMNGRRRAEQLLNQLFRISQSERTTFLGSGTFNVTATRVSGGHGQGYNPEQMPSGVSKLELTTPKFVEGGQKMCGYQSLIIGRLHADIRATKKPDGKLMSTSDDPKWDNLTGTKAGDSTDARCHRSRQQRTWRKELAAFNNDIAKPQGVSMKTAMTFESLAMICRSQELSDYRIVAFNRPSNFNPEDVAANKIPEDRRKPQKAFDNENLSAKKEICLEYIRPGQSPLYPQGHYNLIRRPGKYFGYKAPLCMQCLQGFDVKRQYEEHRQTKCRASCKGCAGNTVHGNCPTVNEMRCDKCGTLCFSSACLQRHLENKRCEIRGYCRDCHVEFNVSRDRPHKCNTYFCKNCETEYTECPHYCFIRPLSLQRLKNFEGTVTKPRQIIRVFFDLETHRVLHTVRPDGTRVYELRPALLSRKVVCTKCEDRRQSDEDSDYQCSDCHLTAVETFYGDDCVRRFVHLVLNELARKASKVYVFAHNLRGFDGQFVVQELDNETYGEVRPVIVGTKILKLDVTDKVTFLDSFAFMPQALAKLPKSLGFDDSNHDKGFFPYLLPRPEPEHADDEVDFPGREFFDADFMSESRAAEFNEFYEANKNKKFRYRSTLQTYCEQDVKILSKAVYKFRHLYKEVTEYDTTLTKFTLAGAALETFRACCLKPQLIGIAPQSGYFHSRNQSAIATAWLNALEIEKNIVIKREQKLSGCYVDGYHEDSKTVYEFDGCFWHGCRECQERGKGLQRPDDENEWYHLPRAQKSAERQEFLREAGYNVIVLKEHDVWKQPNSDTIKLELANEKKRRSILRPNGVKVMERDALFGGRTECWAAYFRLTDEELDAGAEIRYIDFVSLYPHVLKSCRYPKGHPIIHRELAGNTYAKGQFFGLVHCKILAPSDLLAPVLPYRTPDDKLLFGLCRTCCDEYQTRTGLCHHTDEERAFEGLWCTPEVDLAIEKGYRVIRGNAGLAYEESDEDMFKEYINMFLKIKTQASKLSDSEMSDDEKKAFADAYLAAEGVTLDISKMSYNEGLRTIAKLLLNSLWGKLAENRNKPRIVIARSVAEMQSVLSNDQLDVTNVKIRNNDSVYISYKYKNEEDAPPGNTNPVVAAFVTCYGRIKLYELMSKVPAERVLYMDTDSLVYVYKPGDADKIRDENLIGEHLGKVTSEIPKGYTCDMGLFAGSKSYYLRYINRTTGHTKFVLKMKGVSQCKATSEALNEETMMATVAPLVNPDLPQRLTRVRQSCINIQSKYTHVVRSYENTKQFRQTNYKRFVLLGGTTSIPHGYRPSDNDREETVNLEDFLMSDEVINLPELREFQEPIV